MIIDGATRLVLNKTVTGLSNIQVQAFTGQPSQALCRMPFCSALILACGDDGIHLPDLHAKDRRDGSMEHCPDVHRFSLSLTLALSGIQLIWLLSNKSPRPVTRLPVM